MADVLGLFVPRPHGAEQLPTGAEIHLDWIRDSG